MAGIIHLPHAARHTPALSRRSLMLTGAGLAAAFAFGPGAGAQGTPGATAATGTTSAVARLTALLELVPATAMGGPDPDQWLFTWADLAALFAAAGVTDWRDDAKLVDVTQTITLPDNLAMFALDEGARDTFGFSTFDAHQVLVAGNAPDQVTFYAGGLPVEELPAIWEKAGYERKDGEYGPYWTVGQEGELNVQSPISKYGVGALNNVAILDDEVVVFARFARLLQQVQGLAVDGGDSAADDAQLGDVIATLPDDTVNLVTMPGVQLSVASITPEGGQVTGADLLAESDDAVGPMPPVALAAFGVTAGGEDARFLVRLLTDSPEDAANAAEVVSWRVEHMTSPVNVTKAYSDLMTPATPEGETTSGDVATLEFTSTGAIGFWYKMLYMLDLWPFAWADQ